MVRLGKFLKPPLEKFLLRIQIDELAYPSINDLAEICTELKTEYPEPVKLKLFSSKGPESELFFGPIKFHSIKEDNDILLFKESIYFEFNNRYTDWKEIFPRIKKIFDIFVNKLKIKNINSIILDYIDLFDFSVEGFIIEDYFNLELKLKNDYKLDFNDFFIGMNIKNVLDKEKIIIRIRGVKPRKKDVYTFQLETHYSYSDILITSDKNKFEILLDQAHKKLLNCFKKVISEKTWKLIE